VNDSRLGFDSRCGDPKYLMPCGELSNAKFASKSEEGLYRRLNCSLEDLIGDCMFKVSMKLVCEGLTKSSGIDEVMDEGVGKSISKAGVPRMDSKEEQKGPLYVLKGT